MKGNKTHQNTPAKNKARPAKKMFLSLGAALLAAPSAALAATPANLTQFVSNFAAIADLIIPFLIGFGVFGLILGLMIYSGAGANEERRGKGRARIIYGLIGIVVMFSFWGLVHILTKTYLGV